MLMGHLIGLKVMVNSSIRTVQNLREDFGLCTSVWNFSPAVDTGPSLAGLLVTRKFKSPFVKGKKVQRHRTASATKENRGICRRKTTSLSDELTCTIYDYEKQNKNKMDGGESQITRDATRSA